MAPAQLLLQADPQSTFWEKMMGSKNDPGKFEADGEKLRQLTGQEHGPFCPRCLVNPLGRAPVFLGTDDEGYICDKCWQQDHGMEHELP